MSDAARRSDDEDDGAAYASRRVKSGAGRLGRLLMSPDRETGSHVLWSDRLCETGRIEDATARVHRGARGRGSVAGGGGGVACFGGEFDFAVNSLGGTMPATLRGKIALIAVLVLMSSPHLALAQPAPPPNPQQPAYTPGELVNAGHRFFGSISGGLAFVIEHAVSNWGLPNGGGRRCLFRRPALWRGRALHQECGRSEGVLARAFGRVGFRR
jgi:hypothetical protein